MLTKHKKSAVVRLTKNSKIFKTIISAIQEKKGINIVSLDLRKIHEAVSDFFIICEAGNPPQVKAISDKIQELVKTKCNELPYRHEGMRTAQWVLIDYINIVVHVMLPENRKFYKLEELWSDGGLTEHND